MSRRRQSYRPYVGPTTDELHDTLYGTRTRRSAHLTLLPPIQAEQPDDLVYEPMWWLGAGLAALTGVALLPAVYGCAWAVSAACTWLAGLAR